MFTLQVSDSSPLREHASKCEHFCSDKNRVNVTPKSAEQKPPKSRFSFSALKRCSVLPCSRMSLLVCGSQTSGADVRVNLRGYQTLVPQQLLHRTNVSTTIQ